MTKTPAPKAPAKQPDPGSPTPSAVVEGAAKAKSAVVRKAAASTATTATTATTAKAATPSAVKAAGVLAKPVSSVPAPSPIKSPARAPASASTAIATASPMKTAPSPTLTPATAGTATVAAAPTPPPKKPSRSAAKYAAPAVQAPLPPPTSRFADRFAPPRPPTRQMNNLEFDTPRHAHKSDPKLVNAWKTKAGRELTEPEMLAMPDAEYMNDKQIDYFRFKLQSLKDDLLSNAGQTTEHLREDTSIVPDPADRATIEEEHALELRTRDRERKLLKKISQSMVRLDSGEYGFCDETGEPIGLGRLMARPTATLSLEAQQRRELKQKMFGD